MTWCERTAMLLRRGLFLPLAFCFCFSSAGAELPADSSQVTIRMPSGEAVESLKADRDFSYLYAPARDDSWWSHFWIWLGQQLSQVLSEGEGLDFWGFFLTRIIPWTIVLTAIVLVTMKLLGVDADSFLRKKSVSPAVVFSETRGDIPQEDFDQRLEEALGKRNFRQAIRLYYLEILRQLSGARLIEWHPDKTNRHYLREIGDGEIQERFGRLTRTFEYIWYGEASPGQQDFEAVRAEFAALKGTIGRRSR